MPLSKKHNYSYQKFTFSFIIFLHFILTGTALKDKKVGAAALDVYEEEAEYFFEDLSDKVIEDDILGRLLSFHNVLITSHQAYFTEEAVEAITKTTLDNIKDFIEGKPLINEVK